MREGDTAPAISQDIQFWLFAGTFPSHLCPFSREKHMQPAGALHFPGCRRGWQHKVMYKITPNKQIWESQSEILSGKPVPGPKQAVKQLHTPLGQKIKSCWGCPGAQGTQSLTEPHRAPSWAGQLCWGESHCCISAPNPSCAQKFRNSLLDSHG